MRCKSVRNLVVSPAQGNLFRFQRWRIRRHCRNCAACTEYMDTLDQIRKQLVSNATMEPRPALRARVVEAIRASSSPVSPGTVRPAVSGIQKRSREETMRLRLIAGVVTFALVQAASALIGFLGQKPAPINVQPTAPPGWEHKLSVQVVGCRVSSDGKVTETILGSPTIKTLDGIQASLQMKVGRIPESTASGASEINVGLLPKKTDSGSILLTASMKMYEKAQKQKTAPPELKAKAERYRLTLSPGQKVRVLGMTSDPDSRLQSWAVNGKTAKSDHEYIAYFLDVTDIVTGGKEGKGKQPN